MSVELTIFYCWVGLLIIIILIDYINFAITNFSTTITVKNKYVIGLKNSTKYTITDNNDKVYNVNNVWFIGAFTRAESFSALTVGGTYTVKGYGFNFDMFSIYPTIYNVSK